MRSEVDDTVNVLSRSVRLPRVAEIVVLRPEDDAETAGHRHVEGGQPPLLALLSLGPSQRQAVPGPERAPAKAAQPGARVGGLAAEHRGSVEAALDREIAHDAAGREGTDAQCLPFAQADALKRRKARAARGRGVVEHLDRRIAARVGHTGAGGRHGQGRPPISDLQGPHPRRIADDGVGGTQGHGIERPRHRDAEVLIPAPAEVLQRGIEPGATTLSAGFMLGHALPRPGPGARLRARDATLRPPLGMPGHRARRARSARTAPWSPAANRTGRSRRVSHRRTGVRPMRCQPPGLSSG